MVLKTTPYDSADYLDTPEAIEEFLAESALIAQEDNDPAFLTQAQATADRARTLWKIPTPTP